MGRCHDVCCNKHNADVDYCITDLLYIDSGDVADATSLHWTATCRTLRVGLCLFDHGTDINA